MKIIVLGSGAGGGFPQWNCDCAQCGGLRRGSLRGSTRTQSSIAVSGNGRDWVLFNASPDLGHQLRQTPALHPRPHDGARRHSPIRAVVLMDAQIDHVTGLLSLREGPPLSLYCTPSVFEDLTTGLPILPVLEHYCGVHWHVVPVAGESGEAMFEIPDCPTLRFRAVAINGKAPPYSPARRDPVVGSNIAVLVEDAATGERLFYAPGLAEVGDAEREWMSGASCVLVDGTFWREDEMPAAGLGAKLAAEMGHLPQSGDGGMIAALREVQAQRKVLIHINNSNPILDEDSAQRHELARHGIEVAHDGMEIEL
ncbi:pyrroloquinoline quinone biosynthesis protein PqqB [Piscinibacter terrae]|uniref:Coenzyme PQQ synthesis protein B n=1 Tax=Piscinibacter terrae TaxID=2496871 RepID=A0A3N7HTJ9_9BURK|nr:pyrroloquinoline quinone biosynthesis protein PqqB [Albitalea terrae]RQP25630.1 pyrroloquinoline quinone biosynthesis protein PqqB [Albitalea terrae]